MGSTLFIKYVGLGNALLDLPRLFVYVQEQKTIEKNSFTDYLSPIFPPAWKQNKSVDEYRTCHNNNKSVTITQRLEDIFSCGVVYVATPSIFKILASLENAFYLSSFSHCAMQCLYFEKAKAILQHCWNNTVILWTKSKKIFRLPTRRNVSLLSSGIAFKIIISQILAK